MQSRERLTSKELQVAALVWEGLTNREIARVIDTTEQVVKNTCATPLTNWASGAVWNWLSMLPATAAPGGRKSSEPWRPILRPVQAGLILRY